MPHAGTSLRVRQIAVPAQARALSTLSRIDYEDAFLVDVGSIPGRTAEEWARAVVEEAPAGIRSTLRSGWSALGLALDGAAMERSVLGWPIRRSGPNFVLVGARSTLGIDGELLFRRRQRDLLFATFVQQDSAAARAVWAKIAPAHVPLVRRILEDAGRRASQSGGFNQSDATTATPKEVQTDADV